MDKVNIDKFTFSELHKVTKTITELMANHGLDERHTIAVFQLLCNFDNDLTAAEQTLLHQKGIIDISEDGKKLEVKEDFFWGDGEVVQLVMEMDHESKPEVNEIAKKLVNNIAKELLPDKKIIDAEIKEYARDKFGGDLTMARYYAIIKRVYPPLYHNESSHPKWREHFQVTPPSYTRWTGGASFTKVFKNIYVSKTKDIALFVLANYFHVKETIDIAKDTCFAVTCDKFAYNYREWYEYAETHVKSLEEKKKAKKTRPSKRKNKTDTL